MSSAQSLPGATGLASFTQGPKRHEGPERSRPLRHLNQLHPKRKSFHFFVTADVCPDCLHARLRSILKIGLQRNGNQRSPVPSLTAEFLSSLPQPCRHET